MMKTKNTHIKTIAYIFFVFLISINIGLNIAQAAPAYGGLNVIVTARDSNEPISANIYVQRPNGVHVDRKDHTNKARFRLPVGNYKLTVKASRKRDETRFAQILPNAVLHESFEMRDLRRSRRPSNNDQHSYIPEQRPAQEQYNDPKREKPAFEQQNMRNGVLAIRLQDTPTHANRPDSSFTIRNHKGEEVSKVTGVSNTNMQLPPGLYTITSRYRDGYSSKPVQLTGGKTSRVSFKLSDFRSSGKKAAPVNKNAGLQLLVLSSVDQQPLKADFKISTPAGKHIKTIKNSTIANLKLAPQDVLVEMVSNNITQRERISLKGNQTTIFSFTISPSEKKSKKESKGDDAVKSNTLSEGNTSKKKEKKKIKHFVEEGEEEEEEEIVTKEKVDKEPAPESSSKALKRKVEQRLLEEVLKRL